MHTRLQSVNGKGKRAFARSRRGWESNVMTGIERENEYGDMKWIYLAQDTGSFEHGNKTSSIKQSKLFVEGVSEC
jgi:hypothetical protein